MLARIRENLLWKLLALLGAILLHAYVSVEQIPNQTHTLERTRDLFVSPAIVGTPAPGYIVGDVTTTPAMVSVTGSTDTIARIARITTEPVDIGGAASTITKQTRCLSQPSGAAMATSTVTVTVQVQPVSAH